MNTAEGKLKDVIAQAMLDVDNLPGPVVDADYVDAIVGTLMLYDWLIVQGRVRSVRWFSCFDINDNYLTWRVDTEGTDGYFPDGLPEEEEDDE